MSAGPRGRATWAVLWPIVRLWRATLVVIAVCVLLARMLDLAPALLVARVVDDHLTSGRTDGLLTLGVLYLAAVVAAQTANFGAVYLTAVAVQGGLRILRTRLLAHFQRLPIAYFDTTPTGDSISRATADIETIDTLFSTGVINLVGNLVRLVTALGAMLLLSPPLTAIALLTVPPLVALTRWFQVRVRDAERLNRQTIGQLTTMLQETFVGAETVRAYDRAPVFVARVRRALQATLDAFNRAAVYSACYTPLVALLAAATTALLLWAGATGLLRHWSVSIGELTAFVLLFGRFVEPITALGDDWQTVQSALSGIERIAGVLLLPDEMPAVTAREHPAPLAPADGLAIQALTFGYTPARPVVHDVSFIVRPGESVALVGRTGAGKSSIVHLIGGLYQPWAGCVQVAGRDPRTLDDTERRQLIGVVPQLLLFFSGTLWENLTLGDPAVTRAQVDQAIERAGASGVIAALPQGYDTPLRGGPGSGTQLSAGQRQLLALARALVWDPPVLLLDEATAAIDGTSEARLWAALRAGEAGQQRAVLLVAHRLATARAADRVIVLDGGRVIEHGPPDVLIQQGGRFAALAELEAAGWNWQET